MCKSPDAPNSAPRGYRKLPGDTAEFLHRFKNDEFQHILDFDEWIGEQRMLASMLAEKEQIKGIIIP